MSDMAQVNRILDRTCKKAGLDPVEVRLAMIQTLQAKLANGKGFERLPPEYKKAQDDLNQQRAKALGMVSDA